MPHTKPIDRSTDMRFGSHAETYGYIANIFCEEDALLKEIRAKGESLVPGMQVSPVEGKLLHTLAIMAKAKTILEIGTFVGYSTLWLAQALPADGRLITLEYNPENARIARGFFDRAPQAGQIDVAVGKALDILKKMKDEPLSIDLVFIDAAKAEYPQYLECLLPKLHPGSLVVGDNTLLFGNLTGNPWQSSSPESIAGMRRFNEMLADERHFTGILLPTVEGMTIGVKK